MIIAITPTGDRLHQFEICNELMMRQSVKPDRWFIIDDGVCKLQNVANRKTNNMEIIIIQREPNPDKVTLKENLLAVLDKIGNNDKIIFIEDDDYYPDTYIETMSQLLDNCNVVGGLLRKYYNLNFKGYWEFKELLFGTLNSTAFNANEKILYCLHEVCSHGDGLKIDFDFWRKIKAEGISNFLHSEEKAQVIGVKGWKVGRKGAVVETHMKKRRKFVYDTNLDVFNCYFGNFSHKYKSFIERGFLIDLWRTVLGTYFKFRAFYKSQMHKSYNY
jgi:hypothetical protein